MVGIIGAMAPEMAILGAKLMAVQEIHALGMTFRKGTLEGHAVVLLQCGIGKVNAAVGATLLLDRFRPEVVVNTGSAGGLLAEQTFGDIVVGTAVVHHDVDVTAFGYKYGQIPALPAAFPCDPALINLADSCLRDLSHSKGVIGSGDVFVHDAAVIDSIRRRFPQLCAVEMEAAAIAQTCHLAGTPFVVVRALSDIAGKESPMKFEEFLPLACENSSKLVLAMLKEL